MKGSRTKDKDKAKVISAKILEPDKTLREIHEETGLPPSTIDDIIKNDLPEVRKSSEIIAKIIENDLVSVQNMSEITMRFTNELKIKQELDRADITVANTTTESAFKRSQLLQGKATDKIDIGDFSSKTQGELEEARKALLG